MSEIGFVPAILQGLLEGVTEYLPVSSTGHLVLFGELLGLHGEKSKTFELFIQLGAILAVVVLYWERFVALVPGREKNPGPLAGWNGLLRIGACCLPVFVIGALFGSKAKHLLLYPHPVAWATIIGGVAMGALELWRKFGGRPALQENMNEIPVWQWFVVGVFQCLALFPGMSRSGSTMIGGLLLGVQRRTIAELSFLVAVPVLSGAVALDLLKTYKELSLADLPIFATGAIVAFGTALLTVRAFIAMLGRYTLIPFAVYRIVLGIVVLAVM